MNNNKANLSIIIITKNSEEVLERTLSSIKYIAREIIIVDDYSRDNTQKIAQKYKTKFFQYHSEYLGEQRLFGLSRAKSKWILILDSDEIVSLKLALEIKKAIRNIAIDAYYISYENHFLSFPITHGGENYKVLRLFKKGKARSTKNFLHEQFIPLTKRTSNLEYKILHYSYRSVLQVFRKFTNYAIRASKDKLNQGEKSNFKKIIIYPIHMFWARYIESEGFKDGILRIILDMAFAYMEFLTYLLLLIRSIRRSS